MKKEFNISCSRKICTTFRTGIHPKSDSYVYMLPQMTVPLDFFSTRFIVNKSEIRLFINQALTYSILDDPLGNLLLYLTLSFDSRVIPQAKLFLEYKNYIPLLWLKVQHEHPPTENLRGVDIKSCTLHSNIIDLVFCFVCHISYHKPLVLSTHQSNELCFV